MKITGPGRINPTPTRSSRIGRGSRRGGFAERIPEETPPVARVQGAVSVGAVDGILAAQEVADATEGRSRGIGRGHDILDRLDEIRLGLLTGSIPHDRLVRLHRQVREHRETVNDPRLAAILDEIELRASVELAKLGLVD
ncbi:MAG: flagellar assembly protein FliX [Alphaproteobacteria bacterium]